MASLRNDSQDDCDDGVIRVRIENVEELDYDGVPTPTKMISGMPWAINVYIEDLDEDMLCVSVYSNEEKKKWFCYMNVDVVVINSKSKLLSFRKKFSVRFNEQCTNFNRSLIAIEEVIKEDSGFILDDCVTIEVRLDVTAKSREEQVRVSSDFSSRSKLTDVVLIIEKEKLHVGKQILAYHSSFFETLFFGEFKESNQDEITLSDLDPKEMIIFLNIIYDNQRIQDDTVQIVVKLADRFDDKRILVDAENYLMESKGMKLEEKLSLASRYNLQTLLNECMENIDSREKIIAIKDSIKYDDLSNEIKNELFEKLIIETED